MKPYFWNGKKIGTYNGEKLTKHVIPQNYMRNHETWGLDKEMIDSLPEDVVVRLIARGAKYEAPISQIKTSLVRDYKYGRQYFLPLKLWEKV